ncbi:TetR/AcrR family transcriptional regulator [Marinactinospora rubrisoli]|uniref:TetR/AcrR family transcriptional regulator n=1 Tax=Marinactinospora rubrisoli TaxID=2715399 RepID=A0ABW2KIW7_9ACTN
MTRLIEHDSPKASRILNATRELVLEHGIRKVTIAEIARAAGVGKGTVYLYWPAKEELLLDLFGRDFLVGLDSIRAALAADPDLVRPARLAPLVLRTMRSRPLPRRLQMGDEDVHRLMSHHTASREVFSRLSPSALCAAVLDGLREHGVVRQDRPANEQAYALHTLLVGSFVTETVPFFEGPAVQREPDQILAEAIGRLLAPSAEVGEQALRAAATDVLATFDRRREDVLAHLRELTVAATGS